jgi:NLR family CARD domain-containing protein 3
VVLAQSLTLKSLEIEKVYDQNYDVIAIATALKIHSCLTSPTISRYSIDDDGVIAIADVLKVQSSLTSLVLWNNKIGNKSAIAIATALKVN